MKKMKVMMMVMFFGLVMFLVACSSDETGASEKDSSKKDPSYTLRYGHQHTETEPYHAAALKWAELVEEKTKGDLKIEVYPNGQLGPDEDMLEQMRSGTNLASLSDPARLGDYVNEFQVFYAPYFLRTLDEIKKLQDSEVVGKWEKKLEDEHKLKVLSFGYVQGYRNVFANKKGTSPEEFKGFEIRTAGSPIWQASINSLGSTAVSVPYGEVYNALQSGLVDGAELPYAAAYDFNINEVADYIMETKHIYQMNFLVISAPWFSDLPKEYQDILVEEANNAGFEISEEIAKKEKEYKQGLIDKGMEIIPADKMDLKAFEKSGSKVYDDFKLKEARDAIFKELGK
ncbi:C4-dicarboxylate TRAP transporter substrate-binding protein [Neobacillus niacini]|uniref:C4-dicarboxylate TRAP transporter substrate-binding protein n=1 Tax=Neobacillus niacini TaxID=86668 RepID=UPI002FFDA4C3